MNCRVCVHVGYKGCCHCLLSRHSDVKFNKNLKGASSKYAKIKCEDFELKKKCSNCANWIRGEYYNDGMTPSSKGRCSLRCVERGGECALWEKGKTSWRKKRVG